MRRAWLLGMLVLTASCGTTGAAPDTELVVSAAASLTDAFSEIAAAFEEDHPDVDVVLNLGGSSSLREQILGGAGADVFASADRANMDRVSAAGETASDPEVMAVNRLQIAVPEGNPAGVEGIELYPAGHPRTPMSMRNEACGSILIWTQPGPSEGGGLRDLIRAVAILVVGVVLLLTVGT